MDPRRLLTFREVAHERSFSRAAEKLSLSQPSVSHQVALLEKEVGLRLLDRARGGLRLTHAGQVLLEHVDHIAWRLELARSQIDALSRERQDQVRLGAFPTALAGFVPSAIARLQVTARELRVQLSEVTPSTLEPRFLRGEFDLAISYQDSAADRQVPEGAKRIELFEDTFLVCMPPEHRLASAKGPVRLLELADEDWIVASTDGFLVDVCRDAGFDPHIVAVTQDPIATRGLITRGLGVGWMPSLLSGDLGGVATRPVEGPMRKRDVFALIPPGDRHPRADEVVRALVETAGDSAHS